MKVVAMLVALVVTAKLAPRVTRWVGEYRQHLRMMDRDCFDS